MKTIGLVLEHRLRLILRAKEIPIFGQISLLKDPCGPTGICWDFKIDERSKEGSYLVQTID